MGMMPLSTDKPPAFRLVEDFFNDPQSGYANRRAAYDKTKSLANNGGYRPGSGQNSSVIGTAAKGAAQPLFDHFIEHWLGGPDAYWSNLSQHADVIMERILRGFTIANAAALKADNGEVKSRFEMWWICSNAASNSNYFGVRVFAPANLCSVSVMLLTPLPDRFDPGELAARFQIKNATAGAVDVIDTETGMDYAINSKEELIQLTYDVAIQAELEKEQTTSDASRNEMELAPGSDCCPVWPITDGHPDEQELNALVGAAGYDIASPVPKIRMRDFSMPDPTPDVCLPLDLPETTPENS